MRELGTASGGRRTAPVVEAHPLGSVYNFYTWAEQCMDFVDEVIGDEEVALVANSIGSISALQAAIDRPDRVSRVAIVNPNFRELHTAEVPALLRPIAVPIVQAVQRTLRENGQPLFDALAKPNTVKQILKMPYADEAMVTDELVDVLLTPLLTDGAADVRRPARCASPPLSRPYLACAWCAPSALPHARTRRFPLSRPSAHAPSL